METDSVFGSSTAEAAKSSFGNIESTCKTAFGEEEQNKMDMTSRTNHQDGSVLQWIVIAVVFVGVLFVSLPLLGSDAWAFWTWWLLAGVMGLAAMPVVGILFSRFDDRGWMFSKVFAIAVTGYLEWFLVSVKAVPFTTVSCIGVVLVCAAASVRLLFLQTARHQECFPVRHMQLVAWEELLFLIAFLVWTYLAGYHPAAYGTEKFMDYGFMEAMMRSTTLPAKDPWYSQGVINYYYGGQYFAVFLSKLSSCKVEITYNLMRTFIAGLAFALPFSLVRQMLSDRMTQSESAASGTVPVLGGITGGLAVSIAGNMHYVVYRLILPALQRFRGEEPAGYWFPDATRYIGYNPDVPDKTIHEFPCYSFVLGDLHAHVVNIIFVLLMAGLLYAWFTGVEHSDPESPAAEGDRTKPVCWKKRLLQPYLLIAALLLGIFQMNNFWDFVIYYVVVLGTALFINIIEYRGNVPRMIGVTAVQGIWLFVLPKLVIVPFTIQFHVMVDGVALCRYHSLFYQLLILWGLPCILGITLTAYLARKYLKGMEHPTLAKWMNAMKDADLFAVLMFCCAAGLVLIPELVYVRDIYEAGNARANTMFKLTYQAYILFGMVMGYAIWRLLCLTREVLVKVISIVGLLCFCLTLGYFGNCTQAWSGGWKDPSLRQGLDAVAFLENDFPEDAAAIRWLKTNISGSPVVLEANGDSYTGYERVSAMTGLPTVLGWYVHEWLWRSDPEDLNGKSQDVETIYTSWNREMVTHLLKEYQVEYIVIGSREKEKYGEDRLNEELLGSMGEVVFSDPVSGTYILKMIV